MMNSEILFFFGEHMDALPIYERLEARILARIPDVEHLSTHLGIAIGQARSMQSPRKRPFSG